MVRDPMTIPVVWSEQTTLGAWHRCQGCAVLMTLIFGGKVDYPHGIYTDAERDKLLPNRAATLTEVDVWTKQRYGIQASKSAKTLAELLATPNLALAVDGNTTSATLPPDLRRWDKPFVGLHAVCVLTNAGHAMTWLDPLAPMGYAGEPVSIQTVLRWALPGGFYRVVAKDQFAPVPVTEEDMDSTIVPDEVVDVAGGGTLYRRVNGALSVIASTWPGAKAVGTYGVQPKAVPPRPATAAPLRALRLDASSAPGLQFEVGYIGQDKCSNLRARV